jgi:hypothetical protein
VASCFCVTDAAIVFQSGILSLALAASTAGLIIASAMALSFYLISVASDDFGAAVTTLLSSSIALNFKYNYELVRISEVNYELFLRSRNLEVKMLGILANLGDGNPSKGNTSQLRA